MAVEVVHVNEPTRGLELVCPQQLTCIPSLDASK